ncbi:MAG: hypothetical protein Q9208_006826 [Pyrenodesmia sp. 3 TL-2023]
MTWLREESGQVVIDVYRKSDKKYDRWAVNNCKSRDSSGGTHCVQDHTQTLFAAQG